MSEPITVTETEAREYRTVERAYTYEELLDLFGDGTIVRPLVLRCQEHEAEITRLRGVVRELRLSLWKPPISFCAEWEIEKQRRVDYDAETEAMCNGGGK